MRDRESGLELRAAVENAKRAARGERPVIEDDSIYSGLRRRRPDLKSYLLTKSTLISVSHAIEDECASASQRGMLFGSFQRERYYRSAEPRWRDLAASAECAFVLADFEQPRRARATGPVEVPIDNTEPVGREWSLVYDAPAFGAVLSGWERPGQDDVADLERRFEALWSVEPELVRDASTVAYGIVERVAPDAVEGIEDLLARPVEPQQPSLSQLTALTNRMVAYVGGAERPAGLGRAQHRAHPAAGSRPAPRRRRCRARWSSTPPSAWPPPRWRAPRAPSPARRRSAPRAPPAAARAPAAASGPGGAAPRARCRRRTATADRPGRTRGGRRRPGAPARRRTQSATSSAQIGWYTARPSPDTGSAGSSDRRSSSDSHGSPGV